MTCKEGDILEKFSAELMATLDCKTSFTIPLFGGIAVPESVTLSWIIMGVIMILTLIFVRNFKLIPTGVQNYIEFLVEFLNKFFLDILGKEGKQFLPYLGTVAIYIGLSNTIGVFGLRAPTKDLNVTAGLAFTAIFMIDCFIPATTDTKILSFRNHMYNTVVRISKGFDNLSCSIR